ncbi:MAG: glycosyltransferase family 2 protein, partial [Rikenellaceae bacterium]|nr:glycosyltransferase family 2 protein [Rikenellaceae bacterium]
MNRIAVVILNWNGERFLEQFLPLVVACSGDAQIAVADNGSTDGSLALLAARFPEARVIGLPKNYGFAEGYNRALARIEAEYYVLLNSDVEVTPGWLGPLVAMLDTDRQVAAVMPKLRAQSERTKFEYAGASGGFIDRFGYPYCRGRILQTVEEDRGQYDDAHPVFWATGAAMAVRADLYWKAGGLDADFFAHMEEIDLCWRLKRMGFRIMVEPAAVVYHVGGGTLSSDSPHKTFLNYRNNLAMLYKNLPEDDLWWILLARMVLDSLSAAVFLAQGKRPMMRAVWRAH